MFGPQNFTKEVSFIEPNQHCGIKEYISATLTILLIALLHIAIVYFVAEMNLDTHKIIIDKYIDNIFFVYAATLFAFIFSYPLYVMIFVRPKKLFNYLTTGYRWHLFSKERLLFSYPALIIVPLDKSIYSSFKTEISNLIPFWLDYPLYQLDRIIFLGNDPWRLIQSILGDPNITRVIDYLYHPLWILLLSFTVLFHALGRHSLEARLRFFLGYLITWAVLGNALATILSSAGPCYFEKITGQTTQYAELMEYLYSIEIDGIALTAIMLQEKLWNGYINSYLYYGGGITAMPSLHVATTLLFALSMRNIYPIMEKGLYIYTFIIWIGSIHLGWHYAADGPVSVFGVFVIWHLSGIISKKIIARQSEPE